MKYSITATLPTQEAMTQMVIYLSQLEGVRFSVIDAAEDDPAPNVVGGEPTRPLRQIILQAAKAKNGVTRARLVELAKRAGHKPTGVSPNINQLVAAKKLKKIGEGVYRATATVTGAKAKVSVTSPPRADAGGQQATPPAATGVAAAS